MSSRAGNGEEESPIVLAEGERLSLGVAARLSRYLQVLTQARKMGRETISSQELSEYTHINPTQIRRDLSGFGKFGKRGVGYRIEYLVDEIRKILRTAGHHNIALFGAGKLGQAIANSDIFADHGFQIVSLFDVDPARIGKKVGALTVRDFSELGDAVEQDSIVVGVIAGLRFAAHQREERRRAERRSQRRAGPAAAFGWPHKCSRRASRRRHRRAAGFFAPAGDDGGSKPGTWRSSPCQERR